MQCESEPQMNENGGTDHDQILDFTALRANRYRNSQLLLKRT
jgi:hypothetical protein